MSHLYLLSDFELSLDSSKADISRQSAYLSSMLIAAPGNPVLHAYGCFVKIYMHIHATVAHQQCIGREVLN